MDTNFSVVDYLGFSDGIVDVNANLSDTLSPVKRHYVRQAKEFAFGVDNVHFIGEQPAVYFKKVDNFSDDSVAKILAVHKKIWNQGKTPFIYIESPTEIRVYNGFEKPINKDDNTLSINNLEIFSTLKNDTKNLEELKNIFGIVSIDSADFWKKTEYTKKIKYQSKVEQALIDNLKLTRDKLKKAGLESLEIRHNLLLRSLFLLYLEDRGATDAAFYKKYNENTNSFFEILEDKKATYEIFEKLEISFNGNLCPIKENEENIVQQEHLQLIKECFWSKIKTNDKQIQLFDWKIFDFSIIPIELISGIYEDFLSKEKGEEEMSKTGTFYTPRPLAEFILNKVLPYPSFGDTNYNIKVLDPTCGSGIFLVESLNRLLDRWEMAHPSQQLDFQTICKITKDNIFGVEKEQEAIKVAAFSIYLAILNRLNPKKLWDTGKFPYLIYDPNNQDIEKQGNNLFLMSTISNNDEPLPFEKIKYDLVIGNPPFKRGSLDNEVSVYLKKHKFAEEAVLAFLHKATTLCPNGKIALVCGIKILFNTGKTYQNFRNFLFEKTYVEEVYNFSILRNTPKSEGSSLFGAATGPAGILIYSNTTPENPSSRILYCAPKTTLKHWAMNCIAIDATDIKYLPREECKKPNTNIWKTAMWGTEKDFTLIERLKGNKTLLSVLKENGWKKNAGNGFQAQKPWIYKNEDICNIPFIDAENLSRYYTNLTDTEKIKTKDFHRIGTLNAYKKPHILIKAGQTEKRFCSTYTDFDCSFKKAIYGIHIENGDKELKFISSFLNSTIASYILFLKTSGWGIEREKVNFIETLELPYLILSLPEEKQQAIIACIDEIIAIKKSNALLQNIEHIEKRIDELFYEGLNLSQNECVLIADLVNLTLDGFQNKKESIAFHPCIADNMEQYGLFLSKTINDFLKFGSQLTSWATIFTVSTKNPLNIIALRLNKSQQAGKVVLDNEQNLDVLLKEIEIFTYKEYAESIYYRKTVRYYKDDTVYIIKPNEKRFWSRSLAMNDAQEIIAELLSTDTNA